MQHIQTYCAGQYAEGRRVLLLIVDAHLLSLRMMRVLHSLSTIVVANDLAVQIVLAGSSELAVKLRREGWRAMDSRIGLRLRLLAEQTKAA